MRMLTRGFRVLSCAALALAVVVVPAFAGNTCAWSAPCSGSDHCANLCNVSVTQGAEYMNEAGHCLIPITITVTCPGNPSTSCDHTYTEPCDGVDPITIDCDECHFSVAPNNTPLCSGSDWGNMGSPGGRCACFAVTCGNP